MPIHYLRCDDKARVLKGLVHVQKNLRNGFRALHLVEWVFELRRWTVKIFQLRHTLGREGFKELSDLSKCLALVHGQSPVNRLTTAK